MVQSLVYWCDLYEKYKKDAFCLDIEVTRMNGPISVLGLFKPREGLVESECFIRGDNLTRENLVEIFKECKLLITYNGLYMDIPRIKDQFPGVLPEHIPVMDLYLFAKKLGYDTNLKSLEFNLGIKRLYDYTEQRRIAVKLWKKYEQYGDKIALQMLIEYNKQDAVNLYLIAEKFVKMVRERLK